MAAGAAARKHRALRARGLGLAAGFVAAAAVVLPSSRSALAADDVPNGPAWAFRAPVGEAVTAGVCVASLSTFLIPQRRSAWGAWSSREDHPIYGRISDITGALVGSALVTTGGYFIEASYYQYGGATSPYGRAFRTTLIDVESVALASGFSWGIKRLVGRCRPRAYREGKCSELDTDYDAFPSGHTTPVAALAGVRFALAINSTGPRGLRYASYGLAEGAAVATAILRVAAGAHSWEDVLGGWLLGHGTGVLLAYAHPMVDVDDERPSETSQPLRRAESVRLQQPVMITWGDSF